MSSPLAPAFGLQPLPDAAAHVSQRLSRSLGLCLMLLLHLLGLWMVLAPDAPELLPPSAGSEVLTYVAPLAMAPPSSITPPAITPPAITPPAITPPPSRPASPSPPPSASQEPKTSSPRKPRRAASRPRKPAAISTPPEASVRAPESAPVPTSPLEPAVAQTPVAPAPEEDFSARLDAARKRRAAQAQGSTPDSARDPAQDSNQTAEAPESESQRADRIARENIAFQQRGQGAQRDQSGGVFQLRSVRLHNAQFMFRGWNTNFKRDSAQLVEVEQGAETDIEMAVVKRMIALIRTQKPGKFVWKSIRAGRLVNLDASPGYDEELQQFLLKEFFPEYRSSPRR